MNEISATMNTDFKSATCNLTNPLKQQNPRTPIPNQQDKSTKRPLSSKFDMNELRSSRLRSIRLFLPSLQVLIPRMMRRPDR